MPRRVPVTTPADVVPAWRETPVGALLRYHECGAPFETYARAPLLIATCMDHRPMFRMPERFAYMLRTGGANLQDLEFKVSFAIAIGGVSALVIVAHTDCGMVGLRARRDAFVAGLTARAGWDPAEAGRHFDTQAPGFEIADAAEFVCAEARRLRALYPAVPVASLLYDVQTGRLDQLVDDPVEA